MKNYVADYDPDALINGGPKYDILGRVRDLKLLSQTADSGLLELLEEKGLTLSQAERLLPLVDSLNLLPLLLKNKNLLLDVAPLLVEPAPALLPTIVGVLKTPSQNYIIPAALLLGTGLYEVIADNALLGGAEVLLGLPLLVLGTVLSLKISVPAIKIIEDEPVKASFSRPVAGKKESGGRPAAAKRDSAPKGKKTVRVGASTSAPVATAAPKAQAVKAKQSGFFWEEDRNSRRKVIKVN